MRGVAQGDWETAARRANASHTEGNLRWHVSHQGVAIGLLEEQDVIGRLRSGHLDATAFVCPEFGESWIAVPDYGPFARALPPDSSGRDRWVLRAALVATFFGLMLWGTIEYLFWAISSHAAK